MTIAGEHVVISGGGSGVGAVLARSMAEAGARVTILGRRAEPLAAVASAIGAYARSCDVTDAGAVQAALASARAQHGPVYAAVANAGVAHSAPFHAMTGADLEAMLAVNLGGTVNLWQAALPDMQAGGRLIAIASTAGLKGYAYVTGYSAAKHAVIGLTRALAVELASGPVTVNAICPGFVDTPMLARSVANIMDKTGMDEAAARAALKAPNPQKRFIDPEEIAGVALWLMSREARSVTGHALPISGGEI